MGSKESRRGCYLRYGRTRVSGLARTRERWIPAAAGVLLALPFVLARYPPMGDLAFHEAAVSLLRHFGDPRFEPPGLYALNLGQPNQLFHLLAYVLSFVVSLDWACKLVVAGIVVGIAVAAGRLAAHLEVSPWGAVVVAPLALGWMTRWGLVANLLGFAVLLASLPVLDRAAQAPTPRRALACVGLAGLLYLAHESSMLLFAIAGVLFAARAPRRVGPVALSLSPTLGSVVLALVYHLRSGSLKAPSILASSDIPVPVVRRIVDVPAALFSVGNTSVLMFVASLAAVALLAVVPRVRVAAAEPRTVDVPWRFVALGAVSLALYLVLPEALFGSTLIFERFLPLAFAVLVLTCLPRDLPSPRLAPLVVLLPLGMLAATRHLFVDADASNRDLDVVLAAMDDGAAVAQLDLTPRNPSVVAPVVGDAARALVDHGGRLLFSFTDAPTYPVTIPAQLRWDEPVKRMVMTPFGFAPAYDLRRFRYVLVHTTSTRIASLLPQAFAPEARLVTQQGSWMLFESLLAIESITSPDQPFPSPPPTPLAARVKALLGTP